MSLLRDLFELVVVSLFLVTAFLWATILFSVL